MTNEVGKETNHGRNSCDFTLPRVVPAPSVGSKDPTCKQVIDKADKALAAKNKALELSDLAIKTCSEEVARLGSEVNDLRESQGSWYRNPVAMIVLGMAAGTATYILIRK